MFDITALAGRFAPGVDPTPRMGQKTGPKWTGLPDPEEELQHGIAQRAMRSAATAGLVGAGNNLNRLRAQADLRDNLMEAAQREGLHQGDPHALASNTGFVSSLPGMREFKESMAGKRAVATAGANTIDPQSRQLTGYSAQPDYLTSGRSFMGRKNADYASTLFSPNQRAAGGNVSYEQEQAYNQSLDGLRRSMPVLYGKPWA